MYSVHVEGHELFSFPSSHVTYVLRVSLRHFGGSWVVYRRWSKFLELEKGLKERSASVRECVVRDGGWMADGTNEAVIAERINRMQNFFNRLFVLNEDLWNDALLVEFLRLPDEDNLSENRPTPSFTPPPAAETPPLEADEDLFAEWVEDTISSDRLGVLAELKKRCPIQWTPYFAERVLPIVLEEIGRFVQVGPDEFTPEVSSIAYLEFLAEQVSLEKNPSEASALIHALRSPDLVFPFNMHVRFPTVLINRLRAFQICKAIGLTPFVLLNEDHVAVSQYIGWLDRERNFASLTVPMESALESYHPELPPIGPASPVASPASQASGIFGRSQLLVTVASEARDWLLMTLANYRESSSGFQLFGSVKATENPWTDVSVPTGSVGKIIGKLNLSYRTTNSGETEVKLDWQFPLSVDMEAVVNLVWSPDEWVDVEDRFITEKYFGFQNTSTNSVTSSMSVGPIVQQVRLEFPDNRRPGGVAVCNTVRTLARGLRDSTVIAALVSDPKASRDQTGVVDPCRRFIRSLHLVGCEIDVHTGTLSGLGILSPESVFLVAGDLLGERLILWRAFESFSDLVVRGTGNRNSHASAWLTQIFSRIG
jgi:hypothetical protein